MQEADVTNALLASSMAKQHTKCMTDQFGRVRIQLRREHITVINSAAELVDSNG